MSAGVTAQMPRIDRFFDQLQGAIGQIVDATRLRVSENGAHIAFEAVIAEGNGDTRRCAAVIDVPTEELRLADSVGESGLPMISCRGDIAWTVLLNGQARLVIDTVTAKALQGRQSIELPAGVPEYLEWSPDGSKLIVVIASPGASLSDAFGSGRVETISETPSWMPSIERPGAEESGRRNVYLIDPLAGSCQAIAKQLNVWEAVWLGDAAVLALVSQGTDETAWYNAILVELTLRGEITEIARPDGQLARIGATHTGDFLSVIAGPMSDRGVDAGTLLVMERSSGVWRSYQHGAGDTTDYSWQNGEIVSVALEGLRTVVRSQTPQSDTVHVLWDSVETCGDELIPRLHAAGNQVALVVSSYTKPPALCLLQNGASVPLLDLAVPEAQTLAARAGRFDTVEWLSADGATIQGFLVLPEGRGPFPLLIDVHGGPVGAYRNLWLSGESYAPLYVEAGYAVFLPNIRGSFGRGEQFIAEGLFDMCGTLDVADMLSGVAHLVDHGVVASGHVVITGNSYGGLLSSWLAIEQEVFAAAIPTSPVTDWVSQHFVSNLAGFDELALQSDPLSSAADYRNKSPLYRAAQVRIPVLLMAGERDLATPPEQAIMFHRAINENGGYSELVLYPEEGHGVNDPRAIRDKMARIFDFLERMLPMADGVEGL